MYDFIIIGAGPAGCTAAAQLAERGLKVLLVEKCRLPRYKSCSGVLIKKSMDLVRLYFGEETPLHTMCTPTDNRGMIFTNDKGKEYRFEQEELNVWRSGFDNWLAGKAVERGAQLRDCTTAVFCEDRGEFVSVTLHGDKTYTEKARYVLDCEGVVGALKRKIMGRTDGYITTFQTFNRGNIELDSHYFYAYLQPELSQYDAWFNVKDELLVLGVSVKEPEKTEYYYEKFLSYMKKEHHLYIEEQTKAEKWLMPHIRPGCTVDYGRGRILFAGEIAGFLNPMGEGISAGMESGYQAAEAAASYFEYPEKVLEAYRDGTASLQSYMRRQWSFVGGIAETFREME